MTIIEISLTTGRFHATPWGRHVNEGVPEWPPSPYRLLRALFDTWKRKRPNWPEERVRPVLEALAATQPMFHLPAATATHTRSYLSSNTRNVADKKLIFDAFVVTDSSDIVLCGWPELDLPESQVSTLRELLRLVNYMGRSESWVSCRLLLDVSDVDWNCVPVGAMRFDFRCDTIPVACAMPPGEYVAKPFMSSASSRKRSKRENTPETPLPWLHALAWSSDQVNKAKLSDPPAMRMVRYLRSAQCFEPRRVQTGTPSESRVQAVLFALDSKVLPSVGDTVVFAERLRHKLMGIHKKLVGDPALVSPRFSGKDQSGLPLRGHRHAFILPLDKNRDGRLDHVLVVCREPFDSLEARALDLCDSLWQSRGLPDVRLVPLAWGTFEQILKPVRRFESATPFVPPRHYRKGRGGFMDWMSRELRREAANHELPELTSIQPLPRLSLQGRELHWWQFTRCRKGDAPRWGHGFAIEFAEPVACPVVLGYGCHFGLGMFRPLRPSAALRES